MAGDISTEEIRADRQVLAQVYCRGLLVADLNGKLVIGRADDGVIRTPAKISRINRAIRTECQAGVAA